MPSFQKELIQKNIFILNYYKMYTKWKRLATILWLSWAVLATWIWVYAAKNDTPTDWTFNRERPPMMDQQFGSWKMMWHTEMEWLNPENMIQKWWKENRFWFAFIDEETLTDEQKAEIETFQEERDEAIKKINDEFFDKLEKFISEEKLKDYENFVENHENMAWMPHEKWEHEMKWDCPMKNIQKPKKEDEE